MAAGTPSGCGPNPDATGGAASLNPRLRAASPLGWFLHSRDPLRSSFDYRIRTFVCRSLVRQSAADRPFQAAKMPVAVTST